MNSFNAGDNAGLSQLLIVAEGSAGGVPGAEQHGEEPDCLFQNRARVDQGEDAAHDNNAVDEVEPDINGVCRIAGTRPMITQPAKAASMKTYKATKPVIVI
jgi:hypothetical protein